MFTFRESRRRRPAFVTYSTAQFSSTCDISDENRGTQPKPKR
jgi:hypothetical protein